MPKPVRRKKRFINKKEATTYRLIPGYVDDEDEDPMPKNETTEEISVRKEEERAHGIFFDDNYDYMKHLKALDEQAALVKTETFRSDPNDDARSVSTGPPLFFEMFSTDATEEEEIDPDILAALDDAPVVKITNEDLASGTEGGDFLEDDFIIAAGGVLPKPVEEDDFDSEEEDEDFEEEEDDDDDDADQSDEDFFYDSDGEEDTVQMAQRQGRGTKEDDIIEAQTALILRNFEEGLGFRCSNQIPEESAEIPTELDYENLKFILKQDKEQQTTVSWSEVLDDRSEKPKIDAKKYLYEDEDEIIWKDAPPSKPKFDCVSILSLNSNTQNRPTDIIPPKPEKTRSRGTSEQSTTPSAPTGLSLRQLEAEMRESRRADRAVTFRPKDETIDEKKARKKAIKEERKERRQEKKANKEVFSMEKTKMDKESAALSKAVKSVKIS